MLGLWTRNVFSRYTKYHPMDAESADSRDCMTLTIPNSLGLLVAKSVSTSVLENLAYMNGFPCSLNDLRRRPSPSHTYNDAGTIFIVATDNTVLIIQRYLSKRGNTNQFTDRPLSTMDAAMLGYTCTACFALVRMHGR